jgi:NADH:ubiquinone oxidoreductase subunit 3 (subunit A)
MYLFFIDLLFIFNLEMQIKKHNLNLFLTNIVFLIFIVPVILYNLTLYHHMMNKDKINIFECSDFETNFRLMDMKNNINISKYYEIIMLIVLFSNFLISLLCI